MGAQTLAHQLAAVYLPIDTLEQAFNQSGRHPDKQNHFSNIDVIPVPANTPTFLAI